MTAGTFRGTLLALLLVALMAALALAVDVPTLTEGFRNPPDSARPAAYWCWLNGYVEVSQALCELRQFREKGLSGLYVFDIAARDPDRIVPAGPPFMSREWVRNLAVSPQAVYDRPTFVF